MTARSYGFLLPLLSALAALCLSSCGSDPPPSASGGGGFGGISDCEAIASKDPLSTRVTIRIRNSSDAPRYLDSGSACTAVPFRLKDSSGKELTWAPVGCGTCQDALMGLCSCIEDCQSAPIYMIPPGSAYEMTWSGAIFTETPVPDSCPTFGCQQTCLREEAAPKGKLELTASLWTDAIGCTDSPCTCAPGAKHYCSIDPFATLVGEEHVASATLDYPEGNFVEIVLP
jgi:hypothetical protein